VPTIAFPRGHGVKERAFAHPTSLNTSLVPSAIIATTVATGTRAANTGQASIRARVSVILVDFTVGSKARSTGGLDRIFSPDAGAYVFLDVYDDVPLYGQQTGEDRAALPYACTIK